MSETTMAIEPMTENEIKRAKDELRRRAPVFAARVAPFYQLLQWRWSRRQKWEIVPAEKDILAALNEFIDEATIYQPGTGLCISSGGLTVYAEKGHSDITCGFTFEVDDETEIDLER